MTRAAAARVPSYQLLTTPKQQRGFAGFLKLHTASNRLAARSSIEELLKLQPGGNFKLVKFKKGPGYFWTVGLWHGLYKILEALALCLGVFHIYRFWFGFP